jgi:tRNA uridine 5-carboxymethylaminomethyl modification enzyme
MAGINAHLKITDQAPFILHRSDAYIGVLIDDLIGKGTNEPYRMFTSRAEFRTLLRQDNADIRLTEMSYKLGLAKEERMKRVEFKNKEVAEIKNILNTQAIEPTEINEFLQSIDSAALNEKQKASKLLLRPNISLSQIIQHSIPLKEKLADKETECLEQAEIQVKYERYIEKEKEIVDRMASLENLIIPENFDYDKVAALSIEALQKFKKVRPVTIGQASRISGVNPSDVQILMVYMGR